MNFASVSAFDALSSLARPTPDVVERFAWTLIHFLWQGLALAAFVALVLGLCRRASAATRYAIACIGLLLLATAPVATFVAMTPARVTPVAARVSSGSEGAMPLSADAIAAVLVAPIGAESPSSESAYFPYVVLAWSAGAFALAAWRLFGWLHLRHLLRRRTSPITTVLRDRLDALRETLHVRRAVRLLEAAWVEVPAVVGLFRPVILLPTSAMTGLSPQHLDALLAHELAHVRRHDYLVNLLQCLVETLLFYHPAVWWLSGIIRTEREHCCDDVAIRAIGDKLVYAKALADMEELRGLPPHLALAARGNGPLTVRIRRLVGTPARSVRPARPLASALVAIACVLLPLTAATLHAQDEPSKSNTETKGDAEGAKADPAGLKTTPVTPEDLIYTPTEYTLNVGDLVSITVNDLTAAGVPATRTARVGETGTISLPMLREPIKAAGITEEQLRKAIADEYQKRGMIQNAMVDVTITEARGRTFSVLGSARPGQYTITDREFRLLDALITAQATQQDIISIQIIRPTLTEPGKAPEQPRIIEVDPKALLAGDVRQNPIVRPGDRIVVKAADAPKAETPRNNAQAAQPDANLQKMLRDRLAFRNQLESMKAKGLGDQHQDVRKVMSQLSALDGDIEIHRTHIADAERTDPFLQGLLRDRQSYLAQIAKEEASGAGEESPKVKRFREALRLADREIEERRATVRVERSQTDGGKYSIGGDAPGAGTYSVTYQLTLRKALVAGGLGPAEQTQKFVQMSRAVGPNTQKTILRDVPIAMCLEGVLADLEIASGDVITITRERSTTTPTGRN